MFTGRDQQIGLHGIHPTSQILENIPGTGSDAAAVETLKLRGKLDADTSRAGRPEIELYAPLERIAHRGRRHLETTGELSIVVAAGRVDLVDHRRPARHIRKDRDQSATGIQNPGLVLFADELEIEKQPTNYFIDEDRKVFSLVPETSACRTKPVDGCGTFPTYGCGYQSPITYFHFARVPRDAEHAPDRTIEIHPGECLVIKPVDGFGAPPP